MRCLDEDKWNNLGGSHQHKHCKNFYPYPVCNTAQSFASVWPRKFHAEMMDTVVDDAFHTIADYNTPTSIIINLAKLACIFAARLLCEAASLNLVRNCTSPDQHLYHLLNFKATKSLKVATVPFRAAASLMDTLNQHEGTNTWILQGWTEEWE